MKLIFFSVFILCPMLSFAKSTPLVLAPQPKVEEKFLEHAADKPMGSYLTMSLAYPPFSTLLEALEKQIGKKLKTRGEAHVTVISPVEYDSILKKNLKIEKINSMASAEKIQKSRLKFLCLGKGTKTEADGKVLETYYVVIESKDLRKLRQKISDEFVKAGGSKSDFKAELFYPHVTLGFTDRDLHFEDGVVKDEKSCFLGLKGQ